MPFSRYVTHPEVEIGQRAGFNVPMGMLIAFSAIAVLL
jgi:hypothetical protein